MLVNDLVWVFAVLKESAWNSSGSTPAVHDLFSFKYTLK